MTEPFKASTLTQFLNDTLSAAKFKPKIMPLALETIIASRERGRSLPIKMIEDVEPCTVTAAHVQNICDAFLQNILTQDGVIYIATAIELSSCFVLELDAVESAVTQLADATSDEPWTNDFITNVRNTVSQN